jgi:hypothetical protein
MYNEKLEKRTLAIAGMVAVMLLAATVVSMATTEYAFAYNKNQATGQNNDCGNGDFPEDVFCQNLASQIQGDHNTVAMAAEQGFAEDGNGPPPPPGACEDCLRMLSDAQLQALAVEIADQFDIIFPANPTPDQIIDTICAALEEGPPGGLTVGNVNAAMAQTDNIPVALRQEVRDCLLEIF